jgi:glycosyltransferase involved in cell wall biosynthesis
MPLDEYCARQGWQVPACSVQQFRPKQARYCVCVFVLNEGERIRAQLARMQPWTRQVDVIIADAGSTDGALAPEILKPLGVHALLVKQGPGKLSAQMRMALAYSLHEGYDGAIVMDGNNKDDPAALPRFVQALDAGWDHVQGSRFRPGGAAINTPWPRWLGIKLLHAPLISLSAGFRYTDTTNGFRAYSRRLLLDPRVAPFRDVFAQYQLHYYLAVRAARLGLRVCEVPVTRAYPSGKIPTKIHGLRGNLLILRTLMAAVLHRYDPLTQ